MSIGLLPDRPLQLRASPSPASSRAEAIEADRRGSRRGDGKAGRQRSIEAAVVARRRIQEGRWRNIGRVHPAANQGWPRDMAVDPGQQRVPTVDPVHHRLPAADRTPPRLGDTRKGWLLGSLALHAAAAYLCHHRPHPPPPLALSTPVPTPIHRPLTPECQHFATAPDPQISVKLSDWSRT